MSLAENPQRLADVLRLDVIDLADDLPDARPGLSVLSEVGAERLREFCPETARSLDEDQRLVGAVAAMLADNIASSRRPDTAFDFDQDFLRVAMHDSNAAVRSAAARELHTAS